MDDLLRQLQGKHAEVDGLKERPAMFPRASVQLLCEAEMATSAASSKTSRPRWTA